MKRHLEPNERVESIHEIFVERRRALRDELCAGQAGEGTDVAAKLTGLTDQWIVALWREAASDALDVGLVALGGFGREELCLGSDVDLVIETTAADVETPEFIEAVERFIAWARAPRVKLAHAVRTAEQTHTAFAEDMRTAVAYLDARPLLGTPRITPSDAVEYLRADDDGRAFVAWLLEGYRERLSRHGQTIYLLEPDLKTGKGALRDLHVLRWAGHVRGRLDIRNETDAVLGWSAADAAACREANGWLFRLREMLHAISGRKQDRLHFPDQEALAALVIGGGLGRAEAAEALMQRHYQMTRTVAKLAERALRRWGPLSAAVERRIDDTFQIAGGQLVVEPGTSLGAEQIFDALDLASQDDVLLDPVTEERIEKAVAENAHLLAETTEHGRRLVALLTDVDGSSRTSQRLLELGVLTTIVPEFEPVVCHVQHDVYHVYTTDVHLLQCLEFARDLLRGEARGLDRWPVFGHVAARIDDPVVFLLATLFHDIGKNRGGGHSEKGARMMYDIGPRLGLDRAQTDLLAFLVREHLVLSHVARRHDISDRRVVRDLAGRIQSVEALNQLVSLTFADMSNVGKGVMTDWNATLLLQLYQRLRAALEHGLEGAWRQVEEEVGAVRDWLTEQVPDDERGIVDAFVRDLPASYIVESPREALLRVFRVWVRATEEGPQVVLTPDPERGSTEVIVAAGDLPGALAQITGTLSSVGLNILDARIATTSRGRLLDIFRVAQSGGASHALTAVEQRPVTDQRRLDQLSDRLHAVLRDEASVEDLLRKRIAERRLAPKPTPQVETSVVELQDVSDRSTVIQVKAPDRVGLLYEIARTFADAQVDIRFSKVDSLGTQVIDTFYVESLDGQKLDPEVVADVLARLERTLTDSQLHD